jgi:putative membrane protein
MIAKQIRIKLLACSAIAVLAALPALAQAPGGGMPNQQQPQAPSSPSMTGPGAYPGTAPTAQQTSDQGFVSKGLEGGDAQVELGKLAQQNSQSPDVKQFGQKMVQDNSQMGDKWFKPLAKQLGVSEPKGPSRKDRKLIARLQELSGPQFDTEYIRAMVKDHQQDLKEFKNEAQETQDPNVKQVAQQGASIISENLQMIEQIAKNHNVQIEGKAKEGSSM